MIIYVSGWLLICLICSLLCFAITRAKGWNSSTCWAHALGGFFLSLFWLPICISKPKYISGEENICRMSSAAFAAWLVIGVAFFVVGGALLLAYAFSHWQYGALGVFLVPIGLWVLLILDQRC